MERIEYVGENWYKNVDIEKVERCYELNRKRINALKVNEELSKEIKISDRIYTSHVGFLLSLIEEQRKALNKAHLLLDKYEILLNTDENVLSLIDRYKKALEDINKIEPLPGEYTIAGVIKNIVQQALKE